jgi:hypothetical protein
MRTTGSVRTLLVVLTLLLTTSCVQPVSDSPYRFIVGERSSYVLEYASTSASDFSAIFSPSGSEPPNVPSPLRQSFETTVRGTITVTVLDRDSDGVTTAVRLPEARVELIANGLNAPEDAAIIAADLGKTVFARISRRGRVISVLVDPSVGVTSRGYLLSLLAATQFVFPEGRRPASGAWTVEEEGPNGPYVAEYRRAESAENTSAAGARAKFVKTKARYLPPPKKKISKAIEIGTVVIPKGETEALFDFGEGRLVSLGGTETEDLFINEQPVGGARNTIRLLYKGKDAPSATEMTALSTARTALASAAAAVPLSAKPSGKEADAASYRKDLGDATLEGLLAELKGAEASAGPKFDPTPLYLKFRALIYLHPEACAAVGATLGGARPDGVTMKVLGTALNSIGHAEAQAALVAAVKERRADENALFKLLFALSTVAEPTLEAEAVLRDLADESTEPNIAVMARLALGSMARRLGQTAPPRAAAIVAKFSRELASAPTPEAQKPYLLALGNAGSADGLPAVKRFIEDANPDLRGAAVRALRFLESAEAEGLILRALASDPEAEVRTQAAGALDKRELTPAAFEIEKNAFLNDASPLVRLAVMGNLWKARREFPAVKGLIEQAARNDPSKDVREAAGALLGDRR